MATARLLRIATSTTAAGLVLLGLAAGASAQAGGERVHSVRRMGGTTQFTAPVRTVGQLTQAFARPRTQRDLTTVRKIAEMSYLEADIKKAIADGAVREVTIAPGTTLQWMALRRGGTRADLLRLARWDGAKPFPAFEFEVTSGGEVYTFVIPQDCGNLSLVKREPVRAAAAMAPPPPPPPAAPTPAPIAAPPAPAPPPPPPPPAPVVVPPPPPAPPAVVRTVRPFVAAFVGKQRRQYDENDPAGLGTAFLPGFCDPLFGGKVGIEKTLKNNWVFAPAVGFAFNADEASRSSLFVDAEINKRFDNRAYIGTGLGLWDITHGDFITPTALLHFGLPLWKGDDQRTLFFVTEGRVLLRRASDIDSNYQFWGGLRYLFH